MEEKEMKRSEINKALKELEAMCEERKFYLPTSAILHLSNGKQKGMNTMRFGIVCSGGISPITAWVISIK